MWRQLIAIVDGSMDHMPDQDRPEVDAIGRDSAERAGPGDVVRERVGGR